MKKQITVLVPVNAPDLEKEFGSRIKADKVRTIFLYMNGVRKMMLENKNFAPGVARETGYRPVDSEDIQFLIGNEYKKFMDHLQRLGIIELDKRSYVPGKYTMLYRLRFGANVKKGDRMFRQERITHGKRIERIHAFFVPNYTRQRTEFFSGNGWYKPHLRFIESLRLSDDAVTYAITKSKKTDRVLDTIHNFNNGLHRFVNRDTFGRRIHHQLVNLPKTLRPFLKVNNSKEQLRILDVKNAQPYLLGALLYKSGLLALLPDFEVLRPIIEPFQKKPDVRIFFEHCADGQLNEIWMNQTGMSKKKSKTALLQHVFYSAESDHHKSEKVREDRLKTRALFKSLYPSVLQALVALKQIRKEDFPLAYELTKRNGKRGRMYSVPALVAQRLESRIFHELIRMQLAEMNIPVGTIHDAWIIREKDMEMFNQVFRIAFETLGIRQPVLASDEKKPEDNNIAGEK